MVRMARIIKRKSLERDITFQEPLKIGFGISKETVENPQMVLGHTIIPPGARSPRHYHIYNDIGTYILKGRLRYFFGSSHEQQEFVAEAGDFVFCPQGIIHSSLNLSDTEPAELIFCYAGVGSKEETGTVFVELPWK